MLQVLFTLDYEIHGNGQGSLERLMVKPTARMLRQFDRHGAKRRLWPMSGRSFAFAATLERRVAMSSLYGEIKEQLRTAVRTGNDVQFHVHPSF